MREEQQEAHAQGEARFTTKAQDSEKAQASDPARAMDDVWPIGKRNAYFTCLIAFLLGLFDLADRFIIAALFPYIKAEYALTDAQLGSLSAVVNLSIAVLVVPSAYFIDRWSRTKMMCLMGLVWSFATGACAFAGSFGHLLAARFFVGAGEAGYNPAAQSLLAASFPKRMRTTAIGLAQFGMAMGPALGLVVGAYVATHWGWRHAFGLVAIPGILLSFLALLLKDFKNVVPEKQAEIQPVAGNKIQGEPYLNVVMGLLKTPSLFCLFLGQSLLLVQGGMLQSWMPSYFSRMGDMPILRASSLYAGVSLFGCFGIVLIGPLVDWLRRKRSNASSLYISTVMVVCAIGWVLLLFGMTPGSMAQVVVIAALSFASTSTSAVVPALVMDLAPPAHRATAVSLLVTMQNLVGYTVGPVLAGFLSDYFGGNLGYAIAWGSVAIGLAALCYTVTIFTYDRDMARNTHGEVKFE